MPLLDRTNRFAPPNRGLTGWWPFDKDLLDYSGRAHHGLGSSMLKSPNIGADEKVGTARFDGGYVDTRTPISSYMSNSTGSIAIWVYPTGSAPAVGNAPSGRAIICDGSGVDGEYFGISRASVSGQDRLWCYLYDGAYRVVGGVYKQDRWTHIVWVHSGGVLFQYVNGTLSGSVSAGNIALLTFNVRFGVRFDTTNGLFAGLMRDARIYNRALNAEEIKDLYFRNLLLFRETPDIYPGTSTPSTIALSRIIPMTSGIIMGGFVG